MALEKEDLKQIKGIVEESVGDLFDAVAKGFESVDKRFNENDAAHRRFNARLDTIETDLANLQRSS